MHMSPLCIHIGRLKNLGGTKWITQKVALWIFFTETALKSLHYFVFFCLCIVFFNQKSSWDILKIKDRKQYPIVFTIK